ncbi:TPA: acyltransferase family protein [Escherichia coli]
MKQERLYFIDFMRVMAVLSIFVYHYTMTVQQYGYTPHFDRLIGESATFGVSFFIIISGVVLKRGNKNFNLYSFYKKRAKAIYPSFWVAYAAFSIYAFVKYNAISLHPEISSIITTISGFDGWTIWMGPNSYLVGEWFIGFILLIYLICPVFIIYSDRFPILCLLSSLSISSLSYYFNSEFSSVVPFMNPNPMWNPTTRLFEFVAGIILINKIVVDKKHVREFFVISCVVVSIYVFSGIKISNSFECIPLFISVFILMSLAYEKIRTDAMCKFFGGLSIYTFMVFLTHHRMLYELSSTNTLNLHGVFQFVFGLVACMLLCLAISHFLNKVVSKLK